MSLQSVHSYSLSTTRAVSPQSSGWITYQDQPYTHPHTSAVPYHLHMVTATIYFRLATVITDCLLLTPVTHDCQLLTLSHTTVNCWYCYSLLSTVDTCHTRVSTVDTVTHYCQLLTPVTHDCQLLTLSLITVNCWHLSQTTVNCWHLSQTTVNCWQLSQTTVNCWDLSHNMYRPLQSPKL